MSYEVRIHNLPTEAQVLVGFADCTGRVFLTLYHVIDNTQSLLDLDVTPYIGFQGLITRRSDPKLTVRVLPHDIGKRHFDYQMPLNPNMVNVLTVPNPAVEKTYNNIG